MTPGSRRIETPAIPLEIGNCTTVASLPKLPPIARPSDFSSANLKVGKSLPESNGSGRLFLKAKSSSAAAFIPTRLAAVAAEPMNPRRESFDMVSVLWCSHLRSAQDQAGTTGVLSSAAACVVPTSVAVAPAANAAAPVRKVRRRKLDIEGSYWEGYWERDASIMASEARSLKARLSPVGRFQERVKGTPLRPRRPEPRGRESALWVSHSKGK